MKARLTPGSLPATILDPSRHPETPMNRLLAPFAALALLLTLSAPVLAGEKEDAKAADAARVLGEIMRIPETAVPEKMFTDAHAIAVIPDVVKAGLVLGGRGGTGLISVRSPDGTWSNPSFIKLGGASIGFQGGVQSSDVILVFRSPRGVENIVNGKITLGADASVAAGPVGRTAQASTDGELKAEIYSYSRARGLFAGVALDGTVLRINHKANEAVYGRNTTPRQIFEGRVGAPSSPVVDFRDRLEENTVPQD
jgi:lipid-binding SYLF domain-containing protein